MTKTKVERKSNKGIIRMTTLSGQISEMILNTCGDDLGERLQVLDSIICFTTNRKYRLVRID